MIYNGETLDYQSLSWPYFDLFSPYFQREMERRDGEFGGDLLTKLGNVFASEDIAASKDDLRIIDKLLSMRPTPKIPENALGWAKEKGRWEIVERFNLAEMGDSLSQSVGKARKSGIKRRSRRRETSQNNGHPFGGGGYG